MSFLFNLTFSKRHREMFPHFGNSRWLYRELNLHSRSLEEIALGVGMFRIWGVWLQVQVKAHFHFDVLFSSKLMWVVGSFCFLPVTFICFRLDLWFHMSSTENQLVFFWSAWQGSVVFSCSGLELQHFSEEKLCCLIFYFAIPQWPWTLLMCLYSCLLRICFLKMVVEILTEI